MKQELLQKLIQQLLQSIKELDSYIEAEKEAAIQAPSRMESRYDSEKQEASYRANELMERKEFMMQAMKIITEFIPHIPQRCIKMEIGALITTQDDQQNTRIYFILPAGEGEIIEQNNVSDHIFILSPHSPIFSTLEGKQIGDTYVFRDKMFTVVDIK